MNSFQNGSNAMDTFAAAEGPKFKIQAPDFPAEKAIKVSHGGSECNHHGPRRIYRRDYTDDRCLLDGAADGGVLIDGFTNSIGFFRRFSRRNGRADGFLGASPGEWPRLNYPLNVHVRYRGGDSVFFCF